MGVGVVHSTFKQQISVQLESLSLSFVVVKEITRSQNVSYALLDTQYLISLNLFFTMDHGKSV